MARCLISFGANLGAPAVTIGQAAEQIETLLGSRLVSLTLSRPVRTPAVGGPAGQPPFVNAVAALEVTDCSAWDIWHVVREVEHNLGRVRQERWEARRIDLDVLLFDDQRIWTPQFKLPHPRMIMRRFILEPARDVAATWIEPVSGWTVDQLATALATAPASLTLISYDAKRDQGLVDHAARIARCEIVSSWIESLQLNQPSDHSLSSHSRVPSSEAGELPTAPRGRWLSLVTANQISHETVGTNARTHPKLYPTARLVCVLAPSSRIVDGAWEDIHRPLARWMGLCPSPPAQEHHQENWPLPGPRYLLSTDDMAWTQHEIVAAMDAMDCPVEPMKS